MTPSTAMVAVTLSAEFGASWRHEVSRVSLMHGWAPVLAQAAAATVLVLAVGWRTRRWRRGWLPVAVVVGVVAGAVAHWYVGSAGLAGDPAPMALWTWVAATGVAVVVAVAGWRGARWGRRGLSVLAVPSAALCAALCLNLWVGYFPTVGTAWNQLTAGPLPNETDRATVSAMQLAGTIPAKGAVVPVTIPSDASHFTHRSELVYLPPAWFASNPPPRLPAVMMIGGEFNTPSDWLRAGEAVTAIDAVAADHGGFAPVFVFVDSGGAFNIDTECVNGTRGNSADHLTKDVVPFMISNFGVSARSSKWGVVGFSAGGTCAVDLSVMHPEMFSTFVDIAGDKSPNTGTKEQTITRLFGGNASAWSAFDPSTAIDRHARYDGMAGWFAISGARVDAQGHAVSEANSEGDAAKALCAAGAARGMSCSIVAEPGRHDWPYAGRAFASALPWLAGQLSTPGFRRTPLPATAIPNSPARPLLASSGRPSG